MGTLLSAIFKKKAQAKGRWSKARDTEWDYQVPVPKYSGPPPSYDVASRDVPPISVPPKNSARTEENPLDILREYNTLIVVDDSGSMSFSGLWEEAGAALAPLAKIAAQYDSDGIDIHFLNDRNVGKNITTSEEVYRLFSRVTPMGYTPTGATLERLLMRYISELEHETKRSSTLYGRPSVKPVSFIVITDGEPTDDPESVLVAAARRLDRGNFPLTQVGVQFVQIGSDPMAARSLKDLDDGLSHNYGIRDMVDTTPSTGKRLDTECLVKILIGGINRRIDKQGSCGAPQSQQRSSPYRF